MTFERDKLDKNLLLAYSHYTYWLTENENGLSIFWFYKVEKGQLYGMIFDEDDIHPCLFEVKDSFTLEDMENYFGVTVLCPLSNFKIEKISYT